MNTLLESFASLLFPTGCLHCGADLFETKQLCQSCLQQLELLDPRECRCSGLRGVDQFGACFEYEGAQKSLLTAFKYGDKPYLAKSLAGFMLLQYSELGWDFPDLITYIPQSFLRSCQRGYNQSQLLAEELGKLMEIEVRSLLKREHFTPSQTLLSKDEREGLLADSFSVCSNAEIEGKHILLIDDVCTTGTTIRCANLALAEMKPKSVNAFCLMLTNPG